MIVCSKLCFCKDRLSTEAIYQFFFYFKKKSIKENRTFFQGGTNQKKKNQVFIKKNIQMLVFLTLD